MTNPVRPEVISRALAQRIGAVAAALLPAEEVLRSDGAVHDATTNLAALVDSIRVSRDPGEVWLLLAGLSARLPQPDDVRTVLRHLELLAPRDAMVWILTWAARTMSAEDAVAEVEIVTDGVVVDVDFAAGNDLATGIQRVVRNLLPLWVERHDVHLVGWVEDVALGGLAPEQQARVLGAHRHTGDTGDTGGTGGTGDTGEPPRRVIPWRVPVVLPEVPFMQHSDRLAALCQFAPSHVGIVGYDCIPVVSADLVWEAEREKFGAYLEVVKHADVVAGISVSAAAEFEGFASALSSQGLSGPTVVPVGLPTTEVLAQAAAPVATPVPEVLCVGSLDRRKNQIALVEAAEHLWRSGLEFRLRLIGSGGSQPADLKRLIGRLKDQGRPIEVLQKVTDQVVDDAYRRARVVVFPTLHEGFGLPVVEALSYGVPVITSGFGSTAELVQEGGALTVDPRDVEALASAVRSVVLDDDLHARLGAEARARTPRTWDDYATELWQVLVK